MHCQNCIEAQYFMNNSYQILGNFQNVFLEQKICNFGGQQGQLFYLFSSLTESD